MLRLTINNVEIPLSETAGVAINRELVDPQNPGSRKSDYSKTFTIVGNPEINKTFGHIFALDQRIRSTAGTQFNPDYNPNIKATARMEVDGITIINGFARLTEINQTDFNEIEYSLTVFSPQADFFTTIRDKKMSELDFSDLNHVLNATNVQNSWATSYKRGGVDQTFALGDGYVYPLLLKHPNIGMGSWLLHAMRPAIFLKEVISKIITNAGFTFTSGSFFNETVFEKLIVPPLDTSFDVSSALMDDEEFLAELTTDYGLSLGTILKFNNDSTGGNFDTPGAYNNGTYKYTANFGGWYSFRFTGDITFTNVSANIQSVWFGIYRNGIIQGGEFKVDFPVGTSTKSIDYDFTVQSSTGDVFDLRVLAITYLSQSVPAGWTLTQKSGSTFTGTIASATQGINQTLDFTQYFKTDMTQEKFFAGVCKMFNLHLITDNDTPKELAVIADVDLYDNTVMSLHDKLDHSREITSIPMGELTAAEYLFKYRPASDLESLEIVLAFSDPYGSYRYKVDGDMTTEKKDIELPFASTPFAPGYFNDMALPIFSDNLKNDEIHILIYGGLKTTMNNWQLFDVVNGTSTTISVGYPFAGHIDDPFNPTYDISFGMPPIINLPSAGRVTYTNNNLFNAYWRKWIVQITDINSRVVSAFFRLKPIDWYNITFDKIYQFEGQNFRLLKVDDYDPTGYEVTKMTFLRIVEEVAFVAQTGTKGRGYDNTDGYGDRFPMDTVPKGTVNNIVKGSKESNEVIVKGEGNVINNIKHAVFGKGNRTTGDGQVLIFGSTDTEGGGDSISIQEENEVRDSGLFIHGAQVEFTAPTNGDVLTYNSGSDKWEGQTPGASSFSRILRHKTSSDTITDSSGFVIIETIGAGITLTFPTAVGNTAIYVIKNTDTTNDLVLDGDSTQTIDGTTTITVAPEDAVMIYSDGTNLRIF